MSPIERYDPDTGRLVERRSHALTPWVSASFMVAFGALAYTYGGVGGGARDTAPVPAVASAAILVTGPGAHLPSGWVNWFNVDVTQSDQTGFNDSLIAGDPVFQGATCTTPDSTGGGYWNEVRHGLSTMVFRWLPGAPDDARICLTTWRYNSKRYPNVYFKYIIGLGQTSQDWPAATLKTFIRNDDNISFNMKGGQGDSITWLLGNTVQPTGTNYETVDSFPAPVSKFDTVELIFRSDTTITYGGHLTMVLNGDTVTPWQQFGFGSVTTPDSGSIGNFYDVLFGPYRGGSSAGTVTDTAEVFFAQFGAWVDTAGIGG